MLQQPSFDTFERGERLGRAIRLGLAVAAGSALLLLLAVFIYRQLTGVRGVFIDALPPQVVEMLPPPPPPPPPPPEKVKPPEPTEKPAPAPEPANEQPKSADKPAPAPVTMNAPAQAGEGPIAAGSGVGRGAPSSTGTCIVNCGTAPAGGGMSIGQYTGYLKSALQKRVQGDPRLGRLIYSANVTLVVTRDGRITAVSVRSLRGGSGADKERLETLLSQVRGLDPPPAAMVFPQLIEVRGRTGSF